MTNENTSAFGGKRTRVIIIALVVLGALLIVGVSLMKMPSGSVSRSGLGKTMTDGSVNYPSAPLPMNSLEQKSVSGEAVAEDYDSSGGEDLAPAEKKVIKNGDLSLKVNNVSEAADEISKIAKNNGGDVFSSNLYQISGNIRNGNITVRVPGNNFEKAFEEIKKVASLVVRESVNSQDITEQYTDLKSRLKNKQAEEQSFVKILDQAGTIENILKVTRELSRVRGEIEMLEGRIKYLETQTDMATITASLSEDPEITITDSWRPLQLAKQTINSLFRDIQKFINFFIILIIRIIPMMIVYLVLVFIIYLVARKIYRKMKKKDENSENGVR